MRRRLGKENVVFEWGGIGNKAKYFKKSDRMIGSIFLRVEGGCLAHSLQGICKLHL